MYLSLVIPAYNESAKIHRDIKALWDYLSVQTYASEVLFVDDGSKDGTPEIIRKLISSEYGEKKKSPVSFRLLQYGGNRGKGYAVRFGILAAKGSIVGFADAGLCVPFKHIEDAIAALDDGFDYAIASRRLARAKIQKAAPTYRRIGSKVFWILMKSFMGIQVTDTQCGFKFYRRAAARKIFSKVKTEGFMFDVEALMYARKLGFKGAEFPVEWSNDGDSRYHPVFGTIRNFRELLFIRWRTIRS